MQNQQANSTGLVTSYPNDPRVAQVSCGPGCTYPVNLNTQAFSYDQALSGILMLNQGDTQNVQRIFNFYYSQWQAEQTNFHGFWTTYNAQDPNGPKVEYMKITGSNAWMGIFCLQYYTKTGDTRGRDLATKIGKWIVSLPHQNGGVAMGDSDIWANLYSVENNLSYYSLVNSLSSKAATSADRNLFKTERSNLKNWLKTQAYDPTTGLFKRGTGGDTIKAFDTNSWAVLVLGVQTLKNWGINVDNLVVQTERTFGVQTNGSFGGSTLTAKGFDFSDAANAATIGRTGMKWVEGTNQMISVYKTLAYWYRGNQTKAAYYNNRANYFSSLNAQNSIPDNGSLSYYYADQSSVQIFSDNPYWSTASGAAIASTAWVYFSAGGINPFNI
ncbi:MAG TPA: hypothetical protein VJA17_01065 [Candidatus Omnitrophota bacterium]|nr:hypothetical protein [Candidatus Omnitrophota bacterium]